MGQRPQKLTANVTPLTVQAAKNLVAPANTALIYARIADAWLAATYAPGGPGWRRVMARLRATLIVC